MDNFNNVDKFKIVLDLINKIPEFNGNSSGLVHFLDRVDSLAPILSTFDEGSLIIISGFLRDKIVGKARIELQKHGRVSDWTQVKEILKNNFGERLSTDKLLDKIRSARVTTNIGDFYNTINYLLSRINNALLLNNQNDELIIASNNRIALDSFKNNLPEPTKSIVLSRNPKSLNQAYKIILEIDHKHFGHTNYFQNLPNISRQGNNYNQTFSNANNSQNNLRNNNTNNSNYRNYNNNNNYSNLRNNTNTYNDNYRNNSNNNNYSNFGHNNNANNNNNNAHSSYWQNNQTSRQNRNNSNNRFQQNQNDTRSDQTMRSNNNAQSGQSGRSNRYRPQNSNTEPMDVTLNQNQNDSSNQNRTNFSTNRQNNYPI